jgi:hypothetical protein
VHKRVRFTIFIVYVNTEFAKSSRVLFTDEIHARQQAETRHFIRVRAPQQQQQQLLYNAATASTAAANGHAPRRSVVMHTTSTTLYSNSSAIRQT